MKWTTHETVVISVSLVAGFFFLVSHLVNMHTEELRQLADRVYKEQQRHSLQDVVDSVGAKSVVVYDLRKDELVVGKSVDVEMSLASITKIFTGALAYETFLKTHAPDARETRGMLRRIQDMMAQSSNEEAEALGLMFGANQSDAVQQLNTYTKKHGLVFKNMSGLDLKDTEDVGGRGVTVRVAQAIREVYLKYPELFDKTILPQDDNTNVIADRLDFFLGGKTGFTDYSGGNLAVITQKGIDKKYLVLVLGSTENGRFVDVEHIVKALLQLNL